MHENENIEGKVRNFQDPLENPIWRIFDNLISNGFDSKLLLQIVADLWEIVGTHCSWHSEWCPNIVLFISKEIMFIRYKEMKISKEKLKSSEKLEKRFFDESSAYCCKSEDSSRLTANFEAKYFCKKSKYDWEKIFE